MLALIMLTQTLLFNITNVSRNLSPSIISLYIKYSHTECNPQEIPIPLQSTDHCIQLSTNLTLQFEDEPLNSQDEATLYFETEFNNDIEDGTYYLLIAPPETQEQFRHLYLPPPGEESDGGSENGSNEGGEESTPAPVPFDPSRLIDQAESDNNTDGGSTPIAV